MADVITNVNQGIMNKLSGSISGGSVATIIGWVVLGVIIIGLAAFTVWYYFEKKKFNKKITANSIVHGYFVPSFHDVAKSVKIGKGGFEILYLKKLKTWKLAQGARTGVSEYTFYILPDGYWYPGQVSARVFYIDKMRGLIPVITTNPTMRSQYTALEKQIDALHGQKQSFWDKYGNWVMTGAYIAIIGVFSWLSFREIGQFLGKGSALADNMNKLAVNLQQLANNVCGKGTPGVIIPT